MKKNNYERRTLFFENSLEIRNDDEDYKKIRGHASVFNTPSRSAWWDGKREMISRSAFSKTVAENKEIRALYNHNTDYVLGSVSNGTLTLREDDIGLYFEITPSEELRSYERDLIISLKRGDVQGCSFGFYPIKWHDEEVSGEMFRIIDELKLLEVSLTPFPAYAETDGTYRNDEKTEENFTIDNENENDEPEATQESTEPEATPNDLPERTEAKTTGQQRAFYEAKLRLLKMR